jgi:hypothetical protein
VRDMFNCKDSKIAKISGTGRVETLPQGPPSEVDSADDVFEADKNDDVENVDDDAGNSLRGALSELGVTGTDSLQHRAVLIGRALQGYKQLCVPSHLSKFTVLILL